MPNWSRWPSISAPNTTSAPPLPPKPGPCWACEPDQSRGGSMPSITVNDVDLYYELSGPEEAPVIAFSNSIGTTLEMWDAQAEALSSDYRCLRYDTRGHGRSIVADR